MAFFPEKLFFSEKIKIRVIFPGHFFFMENEDKLETKCGDWGKVSGVRFQAS